MNRLIYYCLAFIAAITPIDILRADSVADLARVCTPGQTIQISDHLYLEGIIVSDYRSCNMELNPNYNYMSVDSSVNDCTAYLQMADGSRGVRLVFNDPSENRLSRYDHVRMDLCGCLLIHETDPDCLVVTGLNALNIESVKPGSKTDIAIKERSVSELTDADLYTFVTLRDVEFVFKDGSYTNIWEPYSQYCPEFHKYDVSSRMDGWASLVRDNQGGSIYMLVNTLCLWRRTGKPLPQGSGTISGIVVHTPMRRYGGEMGRYSIRPLDEADIVIGRKRNSGWKCLTGWVLNGTAGASLEFELLGHQDNMWKEGRKGDRILNDVGSTRGYLWTDSDAFIHVDSDYNALGTQDRGSVKNGAILFKTSTVNWFKWDESGKRIGSNAFHIAFSTKKIQGSKLQIGFEWGAGNLDGNFSWNYPIQWKLEYSIDGRTYHEVKDATTGQPSIILRPLPWWDKVIDGSGHKQPLRTSYDCGMGLQQHVFSLPASVFGKDEVLVRITPASGLLSQIRSNPAADAIIPTAVVNPNCKQISIIRFGTILVDYK